MKTIKVSEATELQLDWLAATCQGRKDIKVFSPHRPTDRGWVEVRFNPEPKAATARFDPSSSWEFGGPIIEREGLYLKARNDAKEWKAGALSMNHRDGKPGHLYSGPTPLIAAMRCYVASKLGDTVEVPEELG